MSIIDEIPEITEETPEDWCYGPSLEDETTPTTEDLDALYQAWDDVADWNELRNFGFKIG